MIGWSGMLASLFVDPTFVPGAMRSFLLLPLCLSISIVYKTIKCDRLKDVPAASFVLWLTIVCGMYMVGIGMWAAYLLFGAP